MNVERLLDLADIIEHDRIGVPYDQNEVDPDVGCCIAVQAVICAYGSVDNFRKARPGLGCVTEFFRIMGIGVAGLDARGRFGAIAGYVFPPPRRTQAAAALRRLAREEFPLWQK